MKRIKGQYKDFLNAYRLTVVNLTVNSSVRKMALLVIMKPQQRLELALKKPSILW